jgi:hypothetical protein
MWLTKEFWLVDNKAAYMGRLCFSFWKKGRQWTRTWARRANDGPGESGQEGQIIG